MDRAHRLAYSRSHNHAFTAAGRGSSFGRCLGKDTELCEPPSFDLADDESAHAQLDKYDWYVEDDDSFWTLLRSRFRHLGHYSKP